MKFFEDLAIYIAYGFLVFIYYFIFKYALNDVFIIKDDGIIIIIAILFVILQDNIRKDNN